MFGRQERQGGKQGEGECKDLVLASCPYIPNSLSIRLGGRWSGVVLRWEGGAVRAADVRRTDPVLLIFRH
jgi:hypothetical protein